MQLIAETYDLMKRRCSASSIAEMQAAFAEWNQGELDSYLIEITADILGKRDPETGQPMVDVILDRAGQKGTGRWAVDGRARARACRRRPSPRRSPRARSRRCKDERVARGGACWPGRAAVAGDRIRPLDRGPARRAARRQDHAPTPRASRSWRRPAERTAGSSTSARIATIWRGGCIIRARFLDRIKEAFDARPGAGQPAARPVLRASWSSARRPAWRRSSRSPRVTASRCRRSARRSPTSTATAGAAAGQPDPGAARLLRRPHLRARRPAGQLPHRLVGALSPPW